MAYDRYIAICKPLHYEIIMNRTACIKMAASAWAAGVMYSALHTGSTFSLPFCHSNIINQFFCEIPQLLKLSCSDTYHRELAALVFSLCLALGFFVFIIVSYVQIFTAVWRIPSEQGHQKAFSTCIPHLIVVSLFLSTGGIAYLKPISDSPSPLDLLAAVLYCVVPPLMNPVIYSMRNRESSSVQRHEAVEDDISWNIGPVQGAAASDTAMEKASVKFKRQRLPINVGIAIEKIGAT
ncbi:olfactory receptor 14L1-like [Alligator mississippiensis]|uniref:olfactory receptor 14L1-like n=1 Tax=Alligator mississippiensis TaxID=8496 RepID=UPI00287789BA|nr:olfactory receptor 14L1-like [Alligator mississippiensis]